MRWLRSSRCSADSPQCVDVAFLPDGSVAVRDSKRPDLIAHMFTADEWDAFIAGAKDGEFDRDHPRNVDAVYREGTLAGW